MFYFPRISSGFQMNKYQKLINDDVASLQSHLDSYLHWVGIYNLECDKTSNESAEKYTKLLTAIADFIKEE